MSMRAARRTWITGHVTLLFVAVVATGCRPAATETAGPQATAEQVPSQRAAEPAVTRTLLRENWDAIYLHGAKVGYSHTTISRVEAEGDSLTETANVSQLTIARAGQPGTQTMKVRALQSADGKLLELATELDSGPTATVTTGRVEGSRLRLETTTTGQAFVAMLPWQDDWTGYFAVEQSLESEPLKPGEQRELKELQPGRNILADVSLRAIDFEETETPGGTQRLLRIEAETDLAGTRIASVLWTDAEGRLLKSSVPALQRTSLRTTREDALAESAGPSFDLHTAPTPKQGREFRRTGNRSPAA